MTCALINKRAQHVTPGSELIFSLVDRKKAQSTKTIGCGNAFV